MIARERIGDLVETIEDARLLAFSNADPVIFYFDDHPRMYCQLFDLWNLPAAAAL